MGTIEDLGFLVPANRGIEGRPFKMRVFFKPQGPRPLINLRVAFLRLRQMQVVCSRISKYWHVPHEAKDGKEHVV